LQRPDDAVDVDEALDLRVAEAVLSERDRCEPARVFIGGRAVGAGERTFVVAEAGVNHDGRLAKALQLVDAAADAGADAVKFQIFRAADLATATAPTAEYQRSDGPSSQRELLARLELSDADFERVAACCAVRGIQFLATPFGAADVERLMALNAPAIKLASTDLNNAPLLRRAAETGLPLIVSTGASTEAEIRRCVCDLRLWDAAERLILLHCISRYPAPLAAANLRAIGSLRNAFGLPCGLSDHTLSTAIGGWAVALGACVLEKHFTLDKSAAGPDHAMSLDPGELREYVANVRAAEQALGDGVIGMTDLEAEVRAVARKSIVAVAALRKGTILSAQMLTLKRPAGGIEPDQLETLIGRRLIVDLGQDATLRWDMLE
jgi:sialic acid synthase SpsE